MLILSVQDYRVYYTLVFLYQSRISDSSEKYVLKVYVSEQFNNSRQWEFVQSFDKQENSLLKCIYFTIVF